MLLKITKKIIRRNVFLTKERPGLAFERLSPVEHLLHQ